MFQVLTLLLAYASLSRAFWAVFVLLGLDTRLPFFHCLVLRIVIGHSVICVCFNYFLLYCYRVAAVPENRS